MHKLRKTFGIFKYMIYMSTLNTLAYLIVEQSY